MLVMPAAAATGLFPLAVSANNRGLEYNDGTAFNVNGIAAWSYFANLTLADADTFLADRAAKGVNLIMASLIEHKFTDQTPAWKNANGDLPFTGTVSAVPDFTTPNEAYWSHVDDLLDLANGYDITVLALPCYIGYDHGDEGWATTISANGTTRMATYGTFLGNRYKNQPNVIWCAGGDWGPISATSGLNLTNHFSSLKTAIEATGDTHLWTVHAQSSHGGRADWGYLTPDFSTSYPNTETVWAEARDEYNLTSPVMPVLAVEDPYGNEQGSTAASLRKQMYQGLLAGSIGHVYGQAPEWYFGTDAGNPGNSFADTGGLDWHNRLDSDGSPYLTYFGRLMAARDFTSLTPDFSATKVTTSGASQPAMYSSQVVVVYTQGANVTVNKAQFTSAPFTVRWYNPRSGAIQNAGTGTATFGSGSQTFTVPDGNDWVFLGEDQALGLGAP